jgi:hypothetical protein
LICNVHVARWPRSQFVASLHLIAAWAQTAIGRHCRRANSWAKKREWIKSPSWEQEATKIGCLRQYQRERQCRYRARRKMANLMRASSLPLATGDSRPSAKWPALSAEMVFIQSLYARISMLATSRRRGYSEAVISCTLGAPALQPPIRCLGTE